MKMKYVLIALLALSIVKVSMAKQSGETAHPTQKHTYTYE